MLESIWFFLWGILWAVYFMLDGFDLGLGTLMPFLAKNDTERQLVYRAMGPHWDGNEVWLITAGGVTFAAFPTTYAVMFSGLYSALMLVLFALILRGVSFAFRNEVDNPRWKCLWDTCLTLGSFLPALLLGVAFANIFRGLPIGEGGLYQGGLLTLINPYGLAGGVLFLLLFLVHGALWLAVKSEGVLHHRAAALAGRLWWPLLVVAALFLFATSRATRLFANYASQPAALPDSGPGGGGSGGGLCVHPPGRLVAGLVRLGGDHRGGDPVRRGGALSQPAAVQPRSGLQPDHHQFGLQPPDPEDHAGRGPDLRAHSHRLPGLGAPLL